MKYYCHCGNSLRSDKPTECPICDRLMFKHPPKVLRQKGKFGNSAVATKWNPFGYHSGDGYRVEKKNPRY